MKVRVPDFYFDFVCTGSECPDTCCVGWLIEIDEPAYEYFLKIEGETGEKLRENIFISDEGKPCFKLNEEGRCAFLNDRNLCQMYIDLGEGSLCALCANYPRIGDEFGGLREMGLSLSCPEVARLLLTHENPVGYEEWEQQEAIKGTDYCGDTVFELLLQLRNVILCILQNRTLTIHERAGLYIIFASWLQRAMDSNALLEMAELREHFSDWTYIEQCLAAMKKTQSMADGGQCRKQMGQEIYAFFQKLDFMRKEWKEAVKKAEEWNRTRLDADDASRDTESYTQRDAQSDAKNDAECDAQKAAKRPQYEAFLKEKEYVFENLLVYYVLRYFMKIIDDGDIYSKAVFAVVSLLVQEDLCAGVWEGQRQISMAQFGAVLYRYSREVEHCEENMAMLGDWFWEENLFQPENFVKCL